MRLLAIFLISLLCLAAETSSETYCRPWAELVGQLRRLMDDCKLQTSSLSHDLQSCLRNKTLISLEKMLSTDVIPLGAGFEMVRYVALSPPQQQDNSSRRVQDNDWTWQVLERVEELFRTHVIRLRVEPNEGRSRRIQRHLFPLMMFAFMKMLVVLVPLGFQFMAVIAGKALLLSKMALMLASAQAMKKVTSAWFDVYHAPLYPHVHRSYEPHHQPHHHHGQQPHFQDWHAAPLVEHHQPVQFVLPEHQAAQFPPVPSVYDIPIAHDRQDLRNNRWQQQ